MKVFKSGKLLKKGLTSTDIDMTFAKVKAKGKRRINYIQFRQGLALLAPKRKWNPEKLE